MSTYICFKCNHQWFKRGDIPPRRCPNHSCRTLKWGRPLDIEKKSAASPLVEKKQAFEELKALMAAVPAKRPVVAYQPPPVIVDQPDYYSEPTVSYD